ncbi:MAG: PhoH family protein [Chthoniobacterales bacterium]|nr:PhoH family protein [Chthoniobacterales bacterium]
MHLPSAIESPEEQSLFFPLPEKSPRRRQANGVKNFVIDTNVLLHDSHSINRFENNHVFIPVEVLSELDRFKNEQTERGANARKVHRFLNQIFGQNARKVTRGVATAGGGSVRILINEVLGKNATSPAMRRFLKILPDQERMDHRILGTCLALQEQEELPTILVTKDLNMQLKAMAIGLTCEDYQNDKVAVKDAEGYEMRSIPVEAYELQRFGSSRSLDLETARIGSLEVNEYVLLAVDEHKLMPARHLGKGHFVRLNVPHTLQMPKGIELRPANPGQQCFLDALLDPEISLITCYGQAGTGKTLLAVAAGLSLIGQRIYNGMTVSRPVVAMGDTLGFLPGTLQEKMHPWLQSIYDAFEVLLPLNPPPTDGKPRNASDRKKHEHRPQPPHPGAGSHHPIVKPYEQLMERGLLEIEALCYIRGRSIPNRFFVLDEAQQLTPLEAKTVVTRMSKGSKLVMVGDPAQIDNPYVDSRSNGLVYARNRLRGQKITAHISLSKGERSALAEMGAKMM